MKNESSNNQQISTVETVRAWAATASKKDLEGALAIAEIALHGQLGQLREGSDLAGKAQVIREALERKERRRR